MVSESLKRAIKKWNEKNREKFLGLLKKMQITIILRIKKKLRKEV